MWGLGPCGAAISGAWWIVPLLGLAFSVVMMVFCTRMMRGMTGGGAMCGRGRDTSQHDASRTDTPVP